MEKLNRAEGSVGAVVKLLQEQLWSTVNLSKRYRVALHSLPRTGLKALSEQL